MNEECDQSEVDQLNLVFGLNEECDDSQVGAPPPTDFHSAKLLIKSISPRYSIADSNDYQLSQTDLKSLKDELCSLNLEERANKLPTLPIERLDILPCGLITVLEIMKFLKIDHIAHSFHNLRFGLVANPEITEWA